MLPLDLCHGEVRRYSQMRYGVTQTSHFLTSSPMLAWDVKIIHQHTEVT